MPALAFPPKSYLLLLDTDDTTLFSGVNVIGIEKLPSLNNSGDKISIKDKNDFILDEIYYNKKWHDDTDKDEGGYSIEKRTLDHCHSKETWATSLNNDGGTPGTKNSLDAIQPEETVLLTSIQREDTIKLIFSENLLFNTTIDDSKIIIDGKEHINYAIYANEIHIYSTNGKTVELNNFQTCDFKPINLLTKVHTTLSPVPGDIVINEILFAPDDEGIEFLELYNNSNKPFDLRDLLLVSKREDNSVKNSEKVTLQHQSFLPGEYFVLCDEEFFILQKHPHLTKRQVIEMKLPALTNDFGYFELMYNGIALDSIKYTPEYHTNFYDLTKGISLERIDSETDGTKKESWRSSSSYHYATPGKRNSQQYLKGNTEFKISLKEKSFSPNGDGYRDQLSFDLTAPSGTAISVRIFDENGQIINSLAEYAFLGYENNFVWDGLDANASLVAPGFYIIAVNFYQENSREKLLKKAIAVEY